MCEDNKTAGAIIIDRFEKLLKILSEIIGISEKLKNLTPGMKKRRLLDEVIQPIFDELLGIHTQYLRIFNSLSSNLLRVIVNNGVVQKDGDESNKNIQVANTIEGIKQQFSGAADEFNGSRTKLRAQIDTYLKATDESSVERGFIWAVSEYFIRNEAANGNEEDFIMRADSVANDGAHKFINTPASNIMRQIDKEENLAKIRDLIEKEKTELTKRFSDVSRFYYHVKSG